MKKILCALVFVGMIVSCAWGEVEINATNFPDQTFRTYLSGESFDKNGDGVLSDSEIATVSEINVDSRITGAKISSLKGIEHFTALIKLTCYNNELTELDVSSNKALETLECSSNKVTELDLSKNTALSTLDCASNQLTELDVSKNKALTDLDCERNQLTELDVSKNTALEYLDCGSNQLKVLDVSNHTALFRLSCSESSQLRELNVSGCTELYSLSCEFSALTALDVSGCTALERLDCQVCQNMTSLNAEGCEALEDINCFQNKLREINLNGCVSLNRMQANDNELTSIDLSGLEEMDTLILRSNHLTSVDLSDCPNLSRLDLSRNQLTRLDIRKNTGLRRLDCSGNRLTELDISENTSIYALYCSNNFLTRLDLSHQTGLEELNCQHNKLSALDLSGLPELQDIEGHYDEEEEEYVIDYMLSVGRQMVSSMDLMFDETKDLPYSLSFNSYMTTGQISNVIAGSVQGFDENNAEIRTAFENGTARFIDSPAKVKYSYETGFNDTSMDVTIGSLELSSLSLNNHVYRLFTKPMTWQNAKYYCETIGGHLATISNEGERELIKELVSRAGYDSSYEYDDFWLGGENSPDDIWTWHWIDGSEFTEEIDKIYSYRVATVTQYDADGNIINREEYSDEGISYVRISEEEYLTGWPGSDLRGFICEWDPVSADFASLNANYILWSNDNEGYYASRDNYGSIPNPLDLSHLNDNPPKKSGVSLNPSYDPRTEGRILPSIKQQGNYGTCWAFGSLGALEASYVAQFNATAPNLSELHEIWYVFKDPRTKFRFYNQNDTMSMNQLLMHGGYSLASISFLSRAGVTMENELPYTSIKGTPDVSALTKNKYPENYKHPLRLKDAYFIDVLTKDDRNRVKNFVLTNGAVAVALDWNKTYFSEATSSYYRSSETAMTNHIVQIVGWDDNYPSENFAPRTPQENGAWLIKNSWGTEWGDNGYGWVSYSEFIDDAVVYIADRKPGGTIYGHDDLDSRTTLPCGWASCVFRAKNDEAIREVSFHTRDNNVSYEIFVTRHGEKAPDNPGVPSEVNTTGKADYAGYHTISLNTPLAVRENDYFSVTVHLIPSESSTLGDAMAISQNGNAKTSEITEAGHSYFSTAKGTPKLNEWIDTANIEGGSCNACIKAFTVDGEVIEVYEDDSEPVISAKKLPDGKVGQYYSEKLSASGATPITWTVAGLPDNMSHQNGTITGTPSKEGTYPLTVIARNAYGTDTKTLNLVVRSAVDDSDDDDPDPKPNPNGSGGGGCEALPLSIAATILAFAASKKK